MLKLLAYSIALSLAAAPALAAGPKYYHQTTAPATCTVGDLWIDTNATAGNQISTCTAANTWTKNQSLVGDCTVGPCLDGSADGGSLIKLWAGTGSYWTALQGGAPEANRSWRLPIAAAPATGETLVMTMNEDGQMGFLPAPETSGYVLSSTDAGVLSWAAGGSWAGDDLGSAAYSDVVALWTTCTGYLKSDGTCDTPSGSATYPSAAGVANWNGSVWGTSYMVDTDLASVSASDDSLPSAKATKALYDSLPSLVFGTGLTLTEDTPSVGTDTVSISANTCQAYDADLDTAAGASAAGASKYFGTDESSMVGFHDLPTGGGSMSWPSSDGAYYAAKDGAWASLTGLYQAADGDLASAATASTAGNLKYWGTNGTGVVGFYDVPTSGGDYPEGYMEIDGGDSTSITFAGIIDGGFSI